MLSYALINNLKLKPWDKIQRVLFFGIAVALLALLISGCSNSKKQRIYSIKVDCDAIYSPFFFFPAKIFLNGQESVFNSCEDRIEISAPRNLMEGPGVIKAQVLLPEGWTDVEMYAHTPLVSAEAVSVELRMQSAIRPRITLYVDNRGSSASEFYVGQWKRPLLRSPTVVGITDPDVYVANVPAPEKEETANLMINGTVIGKLPTMGGSTKSRHILFVDVSGKRKYELTCVSYGQGCGAPMKLLSGKHLYELDYEIAYFLKRAPDRDYQGVRWQLLERQN